MAFCLTRLQKNIQALPKHSIHAITSLSLPSVEIKASLPVGLNTPPVLYESAFFALGFNTDGLQGAPALNPIRSHHLGSPVGRLIAFRFSPPSTESSQRPPSLLLPRPLSPQCRCPSRTTLSPSGASLRRSSPKATTRYPPLPPRRRRHNRS